MLASGRETDGDGQAMARIVYLHIGAAKTGSSYLQGILSQNRKRLAREGILYSGAFYASLDLRGARFQGYDDPEIPGAWRRLVERTRNWSGTAVISHENLASAEPQHIDKAIADLSFAELHVIYTARDLVRQIPAVWQEGLKNRGTQRFSEFVDRLRATSEDEYSKTPGFWRSQNAVKVLEPWARHLGPERVHVVTVPPAGAPHRLLWERFSLVVGIDPDAYEPQAARTNSSLGAVEAALLRRLNENLRTDVPWPVYQRVVKKFLAHEVLAQRDSPRTIALPADQRDWVNARAQQLVDGLRDAGYPITGELGDLLPRAGSAEDLPAPDDVSVEAELQAAVDAVTGLVHKMGALQETQRQLRAQLANRRSGRRRTQAPVASLRRRLTAGVRRLRP